MSNISAVIIACSKSQYHIDITKEAIRSSGCDCIVVETHHNAAPYKDAKLTLFWGKEFNYNACLNFGIMHTNTDYIALCNNDLVFEKDWQKITDRMEARSIYSASPFSKNKCGHRNAYTNDGSIHYGYQIGCEMLGWCIVVNKELFSIIGKLDESRSFWCSDNVYADQLQAHGLKHMLDCGSVVNHIGMGSKTLNTMPRATYNRLTIEEYKHYQHAKTS